MAKAAVSEEYEAVVDGDEFVEVKGKDFAPTIDWSATPQLDGVYSGSRTIKVKGDDRTVHTFTTEDGDIDAWGAAILDSRLAGLDGKKVRVIKTGQKLSTKQGRRADEYKVFVARSALNRAN